MTVSLSIHPFQKRTLDKPPFHHLYIGIYSSFADCETVGQGDKFRHAGFSETKVEAIVPGELYCGRDSSSRDEDRLLEALSDDHEIRQRTRGSSRVNEYKNF